MPLRATKAAYAAADVAINGLMATFAALTNPSDEQILDHLDSVQFRLPFFLLFLLTTSLVCNNASFLINLHILVII